MEGAKEPTAFGWWLLQQMADHQPRLSQVDLARLTGIGQATISRWIYTDIRPDTDKLARLADALDLSRGEVLQRAGHGTLRPIQAPFEPEPMDPLGAEIVMAIHPSSPLTDDERAALRAALDGVMYGYRTALRRRRKKTG